MDKIKILRLQNVEDIIGSVEEGHGNYTITEPMSVVLRQTTAQINLLMTYYLPIQLIKDNVIVLSDKDVLFSVNPTDDLVEYYNNYMSESRELLKTKDQMKHLDDQDVTSILSKFQDLETEVNKMH